MLPACVISLAACKAWRQDRFVISFWVDPIVPPAEFPVEYTRIKGAGFTALLGGFGATDRATVQRQVDEAAAAGLAVIPSKCREGECVSIRPTRSSDEPALMGFQVWDEPAVGNFQAVKNASAAVTAAGLLPFVNLLPNYASPTELGAATYHEYLDAYITTVQPELLSVDHYPNFDCAPTCRANKTTQGYLDNLAVLREAGIRHGGIPFWNFFNTMPYGDESWYDPSESELRWQAFSSLAYGAKGVLYFCYWTPPGAAFLRGGAIMSPQGPNATYTESPHFAHAKRINAKLGTYGARLLREDSVSVLRVSGSTGTAAVDGPPGSAVTAINGTGAGRGWRFLLGYFSAGSMLVHNQDQNHCALATLELNKPLREVAPETGDLKPALDDSPLLPGFQLHFDPGDARLFVI